MDGHVSNYENSPDNSNQLCIFPKPLDEPEVIQILQDENGIIQEEIKEEPSPWELLFDKVRLLDFSTGGKEMEKAVQDYIRFKNTGDSENTENVSASPEEKHSMNLFYKSQDPTGPLTPTEDVNMDASKTFEAVATELYYSREEVNIASDLLKILLHEKYIKREVDVDSNLLPPTTNYTMLLRNKKKLFSLSSNILKKAYTQLKHIVDKDIFHTEIKNLQKRWRLRLEGSRIYLDPSYYTCGSEYATEFPLLIEDSLELGSSKTNFFKLEAGLPGELNRLRLLKIAFSSHTSLKDCSFSSLCYYKFVHEGSLEKLREVQFSLFCKEIFFLLKRDLFHCPHILAATDDTSLLRLDLGSGTFLILQWAEEGQSEGECSDDAGLSNSLLPPVIYQFMLCVLLHQKLRRIHLHRKIPLGYYKRHLENTIRPSKRLSFNEEGARLLEIIHLAASHVSLRHKLTRCVDSLVKAFVEPRVVTHWEATGTPAVSQLTVSFRFPSFGRSHQHCGLLFLVVRNSIRCTTSEGVTHQVDEAEFLHLLRGQLAVSIARVIKKEAELLGWVGTGSFSADLDTIQMQLCKKSDSMSLCLSTEETFPFVRLSAILSRAGRLKLVSWENIPGLTFRTKLQWLFFVVSKT
ncbi:uncharacterized protein LOC135121178 [Zophobas morio]|uniref:uncharacterized protein LOC135121178 n=1 Tax=Zophobas morio TaxID=2755281 RepID=UPI003083A972